jgi:hypothetical protein
MYVIHVYNCARAWTTFSIEEGGSQWVGQKINSLSFRGLGPWMGLRPYL